MDGFIVWHFYMYGRRWGVTNLDEGQSDERVFLAALVQTHLNVETGVGGSEKHEWQSPGWYIMNFRDGLQRWWAMKQKDVHRPSKKCKHQLKELGNTNLCTTWLIYPFTSKGLIYLGIFLWRACKPLGLPWITRPCLQSLGPDPLHHLS